MPIVEKRLSFQMLYFVKNDHRIILQRRWGSAGTAIFAEGPWLSTNMGSRGKASDLFTSGG